MTNWVQSFRELTAAQQPNAGGKGGTLARLYQAGYPVPEGCVILPPAFLEDELSLEGWIQVQTHLARLRDGGSDAAIFAIRSSALSEDSAQASFAGEFETVLNVQADEEIRRAIQIVRRSRHSRRVHSYSQAKGLDTAHEIAVIVQRMVPAEMSGVLFTADPITGARARMVGNFVYGLGEKLVSGTADAREFTIEKPGGRYDGPAEIKPFAGKLFKLGSQLEKELGHPQDIEWAVANGKLYLLQSRPITTLVGHNPATGEWNDSLTGEFLWSNVNVGEAMPEVMTPLTWSIVRISFSELMLLPGYHPLGNIGGRPYNNVSLWVSIFRVLGRNDQTAVDELTGGIDHLPGWLTIPPVPLPRSAIFSILYRAIRMGWKQKRALIGQNTFIARNPEWCRQMQTRARATNSGEELAEVWAGEFTRYCLQSFWRVWASAQQYAELAGRLRRDLTQWVGREEADALLSSVSRASDLLASLGPVMGLWQVFRGEMTRQTFLEQYGHRGPDEAEVLYPRPAEDPTWLDRQLEAFAQAPVDVEALLAKQQARFDTAWQRFQNRYPRQVKSMKRRLERAAKAARRREAARSEFVRLSLAGRIFVLRAGELTGLGHDIFFLSYDEIMALLRGHSIEALRYIPARRETYERYKSLPPYPPIIRGHFNPFQWAADPERRSDVFDANAPASNENHQTVIAGSPGSAGRVEGVVRRLDRWEEGDQLRVGEILVTAQTNIGWTPLFSRAAAIVTDIGAPLSHAAVVARELGIPAVVGCGNATMRLKTGDRVRVDGGRGQVEILDSDGVGTPHLATTAEWNDSLVGDYLWSNVNFGEAVTEVMTPLSWTVLQFIFGQWVVLPGYHTVGNIGGRPYLNISLLATVFHALGQSRQKMLEALAGTLYMRLPQEMEIPLLPLSRWSVLRTLPNLIRMRVREKRALQELPAYLAANPARCEKLRQQIREAGTKDELLVLWQQEIEPHVTRSVWMVMGSVSYHVDHTTRLRRKLAGLLGPDDADRLISNLSGRSDQSIGSSLLASLGPVVGLSKVARGELSRATYLEQYGHRGPHEFELSVPRPAEDPAWLDWQLAQFNRSPVDIEALLANQRAVFETAWGRFQVRYPRQAKSMQQRIAEVAPRAQLREAARSEYIRDRWLVRGFALRAGELSGLGQDIFFLTLAEVLDLLAGDESAIPDIPARKEVYQTFKNLPPYPSLIRGRFDPFHWAADPNRRRDIFDASTPRPTLLSEDDDSHKIFGSPGAAGRVEGVVRRLERLEEGDQLQAGEVLVAMQTDIAWTPLFPRAAAIVTDVGAPLSHAAIVARELGIPAVVGCGNAMARLKTGDRLRVDGGRGLVEILDTI